MTQRRLSPKAAEQIKMSLAGIIKDTFDSNGQVITHEDLAIRHVAANQSIRAESEVQQYGGPAVVHLRNVEGYAIVPITGVADAVIGHSSPSDVSVANAVAGCGAGGARVGWYHPTSEDDPLWITYIGHQTKSAAKFIFHTGVIMNDNPTLNGPQMMGKVGDVMAALPKPPSEEERILLEAQAKR